MRNPSLRAYKVIEKNTGRTYSAGLRRGYGDGKLWTTAKALIQAIRTKWGWRPRRGCEVVEYELVEICRHDLDAIHTTDEIDTFLRMNNVLNGRHYDS